MSCLARSILGLIFALVRRASVQTLSRDELTELIQLVRSLSMSASDGSTLRDDICRLSQLLDQSEIFQAGTISIDDGQAVAEIGQSIMLRLADDQRAEEKDGQSL